MKNTPLKVVITVSMLLLGVACLVYVFLYATEQEQLDENLERQLIANMRPTQVVTQHLRSEVNELVEEGPDEEEPEEEPTENKRVVFVGDSRTIDMFHDDNNTLMGEEHDGIKVYAYHGGQFTEYSNFMNDHIKDDYDVLITWMGANDAGNFDQYKTSYEDVLSKGKTLILCNVGPTEDAHLDADDVPIYAVEIIKDYNTALESWASSKGVTVIDMYSKIEGNIEIDDADGIHYLPRPTTELWDYILNQNSVQTALASSQTDGGTTPSSGGSTGQGNRPSWVVGAHGVDQAGANDCYDYLTSVLGKTDAELQGSWDGIMYHYSQYGNSNW